LPENVYLPAAPVLATGVVVVGELTGPSP